MEKQSKMEKIGRSIASRLSQAGQGLTKGVKKMVLLVAVVGVGIYCLLLIAGNSQHMLSRSSISFVELSERKILEQRVNGLSSYLDSLQQSASGKLEYDSLMRVHPHLLDSIREWKATLSQMR
ncbi:MAG: hypothetical protein BGO31_13035 [Bacteroidetes bacterium 43-16]|nr:MAG: hypothetical protein BGO31_13035 [Bacteroidetes bacterium 43-16]